MAAKTRATQLVTAVLLVVIAYLTSLSNPFTFDDIRGIVENPAIRQLWPATWFYDAPLGTISAGRPVVGLSLALNYALGGESVLGYRLFNLAVHVACGLLLFGLIRRTLADRYPHLPADVIALSTTLLWLAHPLQSECINYISQRTTSMMALFYLATLYCALRARAGGIRWHVLAVLCCAAGMGCKPVMVTVPLMVPLFDWAFGPRDLLRRRIGFYAALASTWVILFALLRAFPDVTIGAESATTPWQYALNQCQVITGYLGHIFWPHPLVFDYGYPRTLTLPDVLPQALLIVALLLGSLVLLWRKPDLGFIAIWLFVILGPTSSFVPISTEVGAERRMYLALAGPLLLLVLLAHHWLRPPRVLWVAGVVAAVLGMATLVRNLDYATGLQIWETAVATRPDNYRAHANYSQELLEVGRADEALAAAQKASALNPRYAIGRYAHGRALQQLGQSDAAIAEYQAALEADPEMIGADLNLRQLRMEALLDHGDYAAAAAEARAVLELVPESPVATLRLVDALLGQGDLPEAERVIEALRARDPADAYAALKHAEVLLAAEKWSAAQDLLQSLVQEFPQHAGARVRLARAQIRTGNRSVALQNLSAAEQLDPRDPDSYLLRAEILIESGQRSAALQSLQTGLQRAPDSRPLRLRVAWYLAVTEGTAGQGAQAVALAEALHRDSPLDPRVCDVLAAAYANVGRFEDAVRIAGELVPIERVDLYRQGQPYRLRPAD